MIYIVILNWNGWKDTLYCLESIFHSTYKEFRVVVCDNSSIDGSMEKIASWANGNYIITERINEVVDPLILPSKKESIPYIIYNEEDTKNKKRNERPEKYQLVLIQNESNRGFSAGMNVGIRYALKEDAEYLWILNNDTIVKKDTLAKLVELGNSRKEIGVIGSTIYYISNPNKIQTIGGGSVLPILGIDGFNKNNKRMDYISGTSFFVRGEVFKQIGLFDETYFFYWEDVDFCYRAMQKGWELKVADTEIYHQHSAAVGRQSLQSDLYKVFSLITFFKKNKKYWVLPISINIFGMIINRMLRGQMRRVVPIIKEAKNAIMSK